MPLELELPATPRLQQAEQDPCLPPQQPDWPTALSYLVKAAERKLRLVLTFRQIVSLDAAI